MRSVNQGEDVSLLACTRLPPNELAKAATAGPYNSVGEGGGRSSFNGTMDRIIRDEKCIAAYEDFPQQSITL